MKKFTCLSAVIVAISLATVCYVTSRPTEPSTASSPASTHSPYTLKRIPSSAVHHSQTGGPNIRIAQSASANWSGYAVPAQIGSSFDDVQGSWIVPEVTGTKGSYKYSSIWVGIDGYANGTVEQIGTEQDWTGKAGSYYAWFEMYPDYAYEIVGFPVNPGDEISAQVSYTGTDGMGNQIFVLTINNVTKGESFPVPPEYTTTSAALRQSAEWVVEAPSSPGRVLPLANFGTAVLSGCSANGRSILYYHDQGLGLDPLIMVGEHGRNLFDKAVPSGLTGQSKGFSVTWYHQ